MEVIPTGQSLAPTERRQSSKDTPVPSAVSVIRYQGSTQGPEGSGTEPWRGETPKGSISLSQKLLLVTQMTLNIKGVSRLHEPEVFQRLE